MGAACAAVLTLALVAGGTVGWISEKRGPADVVPDAGYVFDSSFPHFPPRLADPVSTVKPFLGRTTHSDVI